MSTSINRSQGEFFMNKTIFKTISGVVAAVCTASLMISTAFAANVTVTFLTPGRVTQKVVPQGTNMTYQGPKDINFDGYAFCGWDVALANVQTDTVATAVYMPIGNESQSVEACNVYHHLPTGVLSYTTATMDIVPKETRFLKTTPTPMTAPCRLTAQETVEKNPVGIPGQTCVVKWYNGANGALCWTDVVWYGTTMPDPAEPCMDGLEFVGWRGSWTNITEDREIMACYYKGTRFYYYDNNGKSLGDVWIRTANTDLESMLGYAKSGSKSMKPYYDAGNVVISNPRNLDDKTWYATKWDAEIEQKKN